MPSYNSKYSEEMRTQTAKNIFRSGKTATSVAEELGIDTNTVCRRVRDYRRKYVTLEEGKSDVFEYVELFYNQKRMHASLGYLSPVEYRLKYDGLKTV